MAQSLPSQIPGVVSAKWQSPMDIWVDADQANDSRAKDIALDVIFEGKKILDQSFMSMYITAIGNKLL